MAEDQEKLLPIGKGADESDDEMVAETPPAYSSIPMASLEPASPRPQFENPMLAAAPVGASTAVAPSDIAPPRTSSASYMPKVRGSVRQVEIKAMAAVGFGLHVEGGPPVFVSYIVPGGPADQQGIHEGDRLLAVNGVDVADFTGTAVMDLFSFNPSTLTLVIRPMEGMSAPKQPAVMRSPPVSPTFVMPQMPQYVQHMAPPPVHSVQNRLEVHVSTGGHGQESIPPTHWLLSLISIFFCVILGARAMWHTISVNRSVMKGNMSEARRHSRRACHFASLAMCCGVIILCVLIYMIFFRK